MAAYEVNFDGLVGPTHNYAGLSFGNVASTGNKHLVSNPKLAALQGLEKMKALADMGFKQGVLPPQDRPCITTLRRLGFTGTDTDVIQQAAIKAPALLANTSSASAMWVANAATVSPSADSADGRVHFTVANLHNKFHRSIEHKATEKALKAIFSNPDYFSHHAALPMHESLGDEGAANHNRLCAGYGMAGVQAFVYGRHYYSADPGPVRYPARQTREASEAVARLHQLNEANSVFIQQNPDVIDLGVFHNDVIAVSNESVLFYHQQAFLNQDVAFAELRRKLAHFECEFNPVEVPANRVSVSDAVSTYLFNSQLLTKADGSMMMVVPQEAREHAGVWAYLCDLIATHPMVNQVSVFDLRESMKNGGGPACLRLRVALKRDEFNAVNPDAIITDDKYQTLVNWVEKHYRDRLSENDFRDPALLMENRTALDELTQIMNLGAMYPFQY